MTCGVDVASVTTAQCLLMVPVHHWSDNLRSSLRGRWSHPWKRWSDRVRRNHRPLWRGLHGLIGLFPLWRLIFWGDLSCFGQRTTQYGPLRADRWETQGCQTQDKQWDRDGEDKHNRRWKTEQQTPTTAETTGQITNNMVPSFTLILVKNSGENWDLIIENECLFLDANTAFFLWEIL